MKRLPSCLFAFMMLIVFDGNAVDIYVAPGGSDSNPGTKDKPLASIAAALRNARELRRLNDPSVSNGIHIILRDGHYTLYDPLFIRPEDAGTIASPTWIEAASGESPVLSGGMRITTWSVAKNIIGLPVKANGKVWVANVPMTEGRNTEFRQLWVNNKKAVRAKDKNADSMSRILSWNKKDETCWIPTAKTPSLQNAVGLEMFIHQWWAVATLRIKKFEVHGDSTLLSFYQPESKIQSEHPWPAPWISKETGNSAFYLTNAIQLLDEPGEWYLDISNHKLYYWPRNNEDLRNAGVIVPSLETLIRMEGTMDNPVSYFYFKGISFQHTGWLRLSKYGHVPHQAGMYMLDAYKLKTPGTADKKTLENQAWVGRPPAAIEVLFADNTGFENCRFEHLASTGLDYAKGTRDNSINGNLFKDIGGTAILAGIFSDAAMEVHIPYNPKDEREICSHLRISNNLITNASNEDWCCVGIGAGYVKDIMIVNNEVCDVSYTGISMGWGWTQTQNAMKNNTIAANKIHHYGKHNYDCAGIYTLSAQPGSVISGNYIDSIYKAPYAHLPHHWFYLYTDEGSSYFTVKDNWCPSEKFLQNANGPGNDWINNGPQVSETIKQQAGLQPDYQYLAKEKVIESNWAINHETPVIIELISNDKQSIDIRQLKEILNKSRVNAGALYQWENHLVIFDKVQDVYSLGEKLRAAFPGMKIKTYDDPFYEFNRKHCDGGTTAKEWDHVILTANLVADKKLQQEYLDYHATQFEKWPEVAKGFCNANFQQLLVYRNERQLMLVISIPKGESLDKLNFRTIENNPRVVEWNKLMSKYQQGIEGTKKGEVWVFLKQIED
jgi:hypothetical protein